MGVNDTSGYESDNQITGRGLKKKQRFEKTSQPHQDSKGPQQDSKGPQQDSKGPQQDLKGPPPAQPEQQAQPQEKAQGQPQLPGPKSQKEQDPPAQSIFKDGLQKDTQRQGPQTKPAGAQQDGQQSCEVCDKPPILPGHGITNVCRSSSSTFPTHSESQLITSSSGDPEMDSKT
ncbi:putative uncharacterized protein DDB_G0294196 [Mus caroli]|uniref:Uncharacterized protein n=1 Tax=Mus caroli TaxID=10089 RepID=A0A6P7QTC5_MUSCR|nr:putative uncharacterized protein DDB_G0294196 [Mus caroli]